MIGIDCYVSCMFQSSIVSPFSMQQQQLAMLAQQQSLLMAAAAKAAPGNTQHQSSSNDGNNSAYQQQLALLAQQQSLLMAAAAKSAHGSTQQPASNGASIPVQNWPNMGHQTTGGQVDLQKLLQVEFFTFCTHIFITMFLAKSDDFLILSTHHAT